MSKSFNIRPLLKDYNKTTGITYTIIPEIIAPTVYVDNSLTKDSFLTAKVYYNKNGSATYDSKIIPFLKHFVRDEKANKITDKTIEKFMDFLTKKHSPPEIKLEIWPPNKIKYAYLHTHYFNGGGNLGSSCMRNSDMQRSLNFYEKQGVQIVVVVDSNNKIHARALLWSNIYIYGKKDSKFMYLDRIYPNGGSSEKLFSKLIIKNKWKHYTSSSPGMAKKDMCLDNINMTGICHLPWADTFRNVYYKDKIVTSGVKPIGLKFPNNIVQCSHTADRGYHRELDPNSVQEVLTKNWVSKKDCTFVKRYKGYVLKKNIAIIKDVYYSKADNLIVESKLDGWILKKNSVNEAITDDTMNKENGIELTCYKGCVHKKNILNIRGKKYHKKDKEVIKYEKKYFHISQCFINVSEKGKEHNKLIPKQQTLIMYNLKMGGEYYGTLAVSRSDPHTTEEENYKELAYKYKDKMVFVETYVNEKDAPPYIKLVSGEYILKTDENKKFLKKYNGKFYIKSEFKLPDKNQMLFDFMLTKRVG